MFYGYLNYLLFMAPAILLMLWAQWRVKSAYKAGMQVDARLSGAAAAEYILEKAGVHDVTIEMTKGFLSDHYDPKTLTLRLSPDVYQNRSATAVGIAAHEAGHALQHAGNYAPLVIRNAAVPAATYGSGLFSVLLILGMVMMMFINHELGRYIIMFGLVAYCAVLFFQLVNLPVEFDASFRAKRILSEYQIVDPAGEVAVRKVLNAAGWTYVAATLSTLMTILYYASMLLGGSRD